MGRGYLEPDQVRPVGWDLGPSDRRHPKWAAERDRYGFDSRETWSLDYTMIVLLFERLQAFRDNAQDIVDLTYHVFEVEGETLNQLQAIERLLHLCKAYFAAAADEGADAAQTKQIWHMWAEVSPSMWW